MGEKFDDRNDVNDIAEQLSRINEQRAVKNRRSRWIWKAVASIVIAVIVFNAFILILSLITFDGLKDDMKLEIQEESKDIVQEE